MAFRHALQKAQELGDSSILFEQAIDCCTGFTARWIKYQFLGQDFWSSPPTANPPILTPSAVRITFKDHSQMVTDRVEMTTDGNAKVQAIYERIDQTRIDRKKAGKGTFEYLTGSEKLGDHLDAMGLKQQEGRFPAQSKCTRSSTGGC